MFKTENENREIIKEVVREVCDTVCSTMSPNGKLVFISRSGLPYVTKDGTTVAKSIKYSDPYKDLIALQIAQATTRTEKLCGDGTTTTAFLLKMFYDGFNERMSFDEKKQYKTLLDFTLSHLREASKDVTLDSEELYQALLTTSNNDETIASKVLEICNKVGKVPSFVIRDGMGSKDVFNVESDLSYRGGFADPRFSVNGQGAPVIIENYVPLVFQGKCPKIDFTIGMSEGKVAEFLNMFDVAKDLKMPLVIFARSFDEETLNSFDAFNRGCQARMIFPTIITGAGTAGAALMDDISTILDTYLRNDGFDNVDYEKVNPKLIIKTGYVSFDIEGEKQKGRVALAAAKVLESYESLSIEDKKRPLGLIIQNRYEILTNKVVTLHVGGMVETEVTERKARYEDVTSAIKGMIKNGILPGCGQALRDASVKVRKAFIADETIDYDVLNIFCGVLESQSKYLNESNDQNPDCFLYTNLATGELSDDAGELGIWDSALSTIVALEAGYTTALILKESSAIILGNRYGSVHV